MTGANMAKLLSSAHDNARTRSSGFYTSHSQRQAVRSTSALFYWEKGRRCMAVSFDYFDLTIRIDSLGTYVSARSLVMHALTLQPSRPQDADFAKSRALAIA